MMIEVVIGTRAVRVGTLGVEVKRVPFGLGLGIGSKTGGLLIGIGKWR